MIKGFQTINSTSVREKVLRPQNFEEKKNPLFLVATLNVETRINLSGNKTHFSVKKVKKVFPIKIAYFRNSKKEKNLKKFLPRNPETFPIFPHTKKARNFAGVIEFNVILPDPRTAI